MTRFQQWPEGGWWQVSEVPGWLDTLIWIRVAVIEGDPRVIALNIEPTHDAEPIALTSSKLRSLPLIDWAKRCDAATHTRYVPGLKTKHRQRKSTPPGAPGIDLNLTDVAQAWNDAYDAGKPPRDAVIKMLGPMAPRTADRHIRRARDAGLITRFKRPQVAKAAPMQKTSAGKPASSEQREIGEPDGR